MTIERERRRLRTAFGAAIFAASLPGALQACSNGDGAASGGDSDAGDASSDVDATTSALDDAAASSDGADESDTDDPARCASSVWLLDASPPDAGPDGDADLQCGVSLPCGLASGFTSGISHDGCDLVRTDIDGSMIPDSSFGCRVAEDAGCNNGTFAAATGAALTLVCNCDLFMGGGRRPGHRRGHKRSGRRRGGHARTSSGKPLGRHLAEMALAEAASIAAFAQLRSDLLRFAAPPALVVATTRAGRDEVRHAGVMVRLARERGGTAYLRDPRASARVRPARTKRTLETVATENAVEGCIRETYAALLAHWQATNASDAVLRREFARIAADETRHAALAWAFARWAEGRLDAAARDRLRRARTAALRRLQRELSVSPPPNLLREAGLPDASTALFLLSAGVGSLDQLARRRGKPRHGGNVAMKARIVSRPASSTTAVPTGGIA